MVYLFYTTYISVDLARHEIVRAKGVKGGTCIKLKVLKCMCGRVSSLLSLVVVYVSCWLTCVLVFLLGEIGI